MRDVLLAEHPDGYGLQFVDSAGIPLSWDVAQALLNRLQDYYENMDGGLHNHHADAIAEVRYPDMWRTATPRGRNALIPRQLKFRRPRLAQAGCIYLVERAAEYKVGKTKDIDTRMRMLEAASAVKLRLLHTVPSDDIYTAEKFFHNKFAGARKDGPGELFDLTREQVDWFCSIEAISTLDPFLPPAIQLARECVTTQPGSYPYLRRAEGTEREVEG